jgi:hypothetical protein
MYWPVYRNSLSVTCTDRYTETVCQSHVLTGIQQHSVCQWRVLTGIQQHSISDTPWPVYRNSLSVTRPDRYTATVCQWHALTGIQQHSVCQWHVLTGVQKHSVCLLIRTSGLDLLWSCSKFRAKCPEATVSGSGLYFILVIPCACDTYYVTAI